MIQNVRNAEKAGWGYNAATGTYEDLMKAGVIDPAKVTRTALQAPRRSDLLWMLSRV